jgi:hypothetical protein
MVICSILPTAIWYILWPFCISYDHFVYFHCFGKFYQRNLATLLRKTDFLQKFSLLIFFSVSPTLSNGVTVKKTPSLARVSTNFVDRLKNEFSAWGGHLRGCPGDVPGQM